MGARRSQRKSPLSLCFVWWLTDMDCQTGCGVSFNQVTLTLLFTLFVSLAQVAPNFSLWPRSIPMFVLQIKLYWDTDAPVGEYIVSAACDRLESLWQRPNDPQSCVLTFWTFTGEVHPLYCSLSAGSLWLFSPQFCCVLAAPSAIASPGKPVLFKHLECFFFSCWILIQSKGSAQTLCVL